MTKNNTTTKSCTLGFCDLLALIFITLKLCGIITWSWVWVLAPCWISIALAVVAVIIIIIIKKTNTHIDFDDIKREA